jgi:hypothetical protein
VKSATEITDGVRELDFAFLREPPPQVRPQELDLAASLIGSLSGRGV